MRGPILGVGVLCIKNGRVLLVKRSKEPGKGRWAIPGGRVEFGEGLREAARREIEEETGLVVSIGKIIDAVDIFQRDEGGRVVEHFVVINYEGSVEGGELRASGDVEEVRWISLKEVESYELTDSTRAFLRRYVKVD